MCIEVNKKKKIPKGFEAWTPPQRREKLHVRDLSDAHKHILLL